MTDFPEGESYPDRQRGAWLKAARRPIWFGLAVLIALVLLSVLVAFTRGTLRRDTDRTSYVAKNEQILEQLKPYPGAELLYKSSAPYYKPDDETSPIIGYTTNLDYQILGGAVAREVADYYGRQLAGWKRHEEVIPCSRIDKPANPCPSVLLVFFTRGEAGVSLHLDGLNVPVRKRYELVVDHRGAVRP